MKKRILYITSLIMTPILFLILITCFTLHSMPEKIDIGNDDSVPSLAPLGNTINQSKDNQNKYEIKFLGLIPLKNIEVEKINNLEVYPGGMPIGVRVKSEGVLVVGYSDIVINNENEESPGKIGGLQVGDVILKINGIDIMSSSDLLKTIKHCSSGDIKVEVLRNETHIIKNVHMKKEDDKNYKIGLWIRDSTAGVGTLTFYDKSTSKFGALGHPITDCDTNEKFLIKNGDVIESCIISVRKGEKGSPGELKGIFINENKPQGKIDKNSQSGIFGEINNNTNIIKNSTPIKIGFRDDIVEGKAKILTTIDESGPQEFDIQIEKLLNQTSPGSKSMVIRVTDPRLLEKTGGIVQGMSGSPIIQNGKLVGAVTHVLVNKPDTGYGIYIEWMLKDAGLLK